MTSEEALAAALIAAGVLAIAAGIACIIATAGICAGGIAIAFAGGGGLALAGAGTVAGTTVVVSGTAIGGTVLVGGAAAAGAGAGILYQESQSGAGSSPSVGGEAANFSDEELAQLAVQHAGDNRPSFDATLAALRNSTPYRRPGQDGLVFEYNGVRVIVNEATPWRSTVYKIGGQ